MFFLYDSPFDKIIARLNDDETESPEQAAQILKYCICARQPMFHF